MPLVPPATTAPPKVKTKETNAERDKRLRARRVEIEKLKARKSRLPALPDYLDPDVPTPTLIPPADAPPSGPLAGFSAFDAQDYTTRIGAGADARWLTTSPLRAVMREQAGMDAHIVTERTRQGVLYGAGLGMEPVVIARIMGLDLDRLRELYETELETAPHLMMSDIQTNLYNIARDPKHSQSVRAGMYLLGKLGNRLYREEQKSQALAVRPETRTVDVALLSDAQRGELKNILEAAMRLAGGGVDEPIEAEYEDVDEGAELL